MLEGYFIHILILICVYGIVALGLNLTLGFTGLLNLGHIGFFGIGAYVSAILSKTYGAPFAVSFVVAAAAGAAAGLLLMAGIRKLRGDYLALATLGFNFVVYAVLLNWIKVTGGPVGIAGIRRPVIGGMTIDTSVEYFFFVLTVGFAIFLGLSILTKSPYGKMLEAIRDDEIAAQALGKHTHKMKMQAMMISAGIAALAGSLFAHYVRFIDPSLVVVMEIILTLTIVIAGGLASLWGTVLATVLVVALPEVLRFVAVSGAGVGALRQLIYAVILIVILMLRPRGLRGKVELR